MSTQLAYLFKPVPVPGILPGRNENLAQAAIYRAQVFQQLAQGGVVVLALLGGAAILRRRD